MPLSWVRKLPSVFVEQGFQDEKNEKKIQKIVSHRCHPTPSELLMQMTQIHFMFGEEMSFAVMDNSDLSKSGPAYRRRIEEAAREAQKGAAISFAPEVTIGMRQIDRKKAQTV